MAARTALVRLIAQQCETGGTGSPLTFNIRATRAGLSLHPTLLLLTNPADPGMIRLSATLP